MFEGLIARWESFLAGIRLTSLTPMVVLWLMQANLVRYLVLLDGHVRRSG